MPQNDPQPKHPGSGWRAGRCSRAAANTGRPTALPINQMTIGDFYKERAPHVKPPTANTSWSQFLKSDEVLLWEGAPQRKFSSIITTLAVRRFRLLTNTRYALTKERAIITRGAFLSTAEIKSYPIDKNSQIELGSGKKPTVFFKTEEIQTEDDVYIEKTGFYSLKEPQHVYSLLLQIQAKAQT